MSFIYLRFCSNFSAAFLWYYFVIDIFGCANSSGFVIAKCAANVLFWFLFTRIDGIPGFNFFFGELLRLLLLVGVYFIFYFFFIS